MGDNENDKQGRRGGGAAAPATTDRFGGHRWLAETFARNCAAALSGLLGADVRIRMTATTRLACGDVDDSREEASCRFGLFRADRRYSTESQEPAGDAEARAGWMEVSSQLACTIVDRLLGGTGRTVCVPARPATATERRVLNRAIELVAVSLSQSLPGGEKPRLVAAQEGPSDGSAQGGIDAARAVRMAAFEVAVNSQVGTFRLWMLLDKIETGPSGHGLPVTAGAAGAPSRGERGRAPMELSASLETTMTAAQLADLAPGDIVTTETPADSPDGIAVTVRVAGIPKFSGRLGVSSQEGSEDAAPRRAVTVKGKLSGPGEAAKSDTPIAEAKAGESEKTDT